VRPTKEVATMRRTLTAASLLAACIPVLAGCYYYDAQGRMVPVHVEGQVVVAPPPVVIDRDPDEVWLIPHTGVYFLPHLSIEVFFYGGHWYHRSEGRWYRGPSYRGPWNHLEDDRLPPRMRRLPSDYRQSEQHRRVPYGQWKERGYRWDDDEDQEDRDDRGRKGWKDRD
jgi:hypothetical protein